MKAYTYLYGIKDVTKDELVSAKCGNGGKYYVREHAAITKCNQLNRSCKDKKYKVISFLLINTENLSTFEENDIIWQCIKRT